MSNQGYPVQAQAPGYTVTGVPQGQATIPMVTGVPQQHGQATVPMVMAPTQTVVLQQACPRTRTYPNYLAKSAMALAWIMIVGGILSLIFNAVTLGMLGNQRPNDIAGVNSLYYQGYGLWCGPMYILCGGFTIGAAKHKSRCMIVTSLVLCIIMAVNSWQHIGYAMATVGLDGAKHTHIKNRQYTHWYYDKDDVAEEALNASLAIGVVLLILGITEFIALVWTSSLACRVLCCNGQATTQTTTQYVQYVAGPNGQLQQQVVMTGAPMTGIPAAGVPPVSVTTVGTGQPYPYVHGNQYTAYPTQGMVQTNLGAQAQPPPSYDYSMNTEKQ